MKVFSHGEFAEGRKFTDYERSKVVERWLDIKVVISIPKNLSGGS